MLFYITSTTFDNIEWAIVKNTENGKLLKTKYREAFLNFTKNYNKELKNLPLPLLHNNLCLACK